MRRGTLLVLVCLLAGACRSPRYVPVPVTRTEVRHTVSRDSVFVRDSVSVFQHSSDMYWSMSDYLDVLKVLEGHSYVYFTSTNRQYLNCVNGLDQTKLSATHLKAAPKENSMRT